MGAREESTPCWTGACDGCEEPLPNEEWGTVHCESEDALHTYARDSSWSVTDAGMFCESCSAKNLCETVGHANAEQVGDTWYCERCEEPFDHRPAPRDPILKVVES